MVTRCTCKPGDECENCFTGNILELAGLQGWRAFRFPTWRATCTAPGVPDLWLLRPPELLVIEAKRSGKTLTPDQADWLDALSHVTEVTTFCFSPRHWPLVEAALRRATDGPS